ncbi:MAG: invasion associated locus B family protein [Pseudomonadota bacterium]
MMRPIEICPRSIKGAISAGLIAGIAFSGIAHAQKVSHSAWVKLCEKTSLSGVNKAGKSQTITKNICLTHHERIGGNTGMVIVSAAIRQVEGEKRQSLMVMVPLGMALRPGVKAAVYTKEQWARAQKKERVKDDELKPLSFEYSLCHAAGCTAEIEAPEGLTDDMAKGGGLMVLSRNVGIA